MIEDSLQGEKALSVSAALALAKKALESCTVTLIGEVSEVSNKPGYKAVYFTVKDSSSSMPCMMWLNRYQTAGVDLRVGMLVELTGRFSLYAAKGRMNFDVFKLSLAGEGNLRMKVADLAKKLSSEGLMEAGRKRSLPSFPQKIGLVTSPRGAAIHDVLRTLRRRFPVANVMLAGVPVEGERAAAGLVEALDAVAHAGVEVVLLVRGGGSFEDLMPFNDEQLARVIAGLQIPVVTGIGHEPDTTIADMVADMRASTPTAAAEAVSPSHEVLHDGLTSRAQNLAQLVNQKIERETFALERRSDRPLFVDFNALFGQEAQTLDVLGDRLHKAIPNAITRDKAWVDQAAGRLDLKGRSLLVPFDTAISIKASRLQDLSPLEILGRGYSFVQDTDGKIIKSVHGVSVGDAIDVRVADGFLQCHIEEILQQEKTPTTEEA